MSDRCLFCSNKKTTMTQQVDWYKISIKQTNVAAVRMSVTNFVRIPLSSSIRKAFCLKMLPLIQFAEHFFVESMFWEGSSQNIVPPPCGFPAPNLHYQTQPILRWMCWNPMGRCKLHMDAWWVFVDKLCVEKQWSLLYPGEQLLFLVKMKRPQCMWETRVVLVSWLFSRRGHIEQCSDWTKDLSFFFMGMIFWSVSDVWLWLDTTYRFWCLISYCAGPTCAHS